MRYALNYAKDSSEVITDPNGEILKSMITVPNLNRQSMSREVLCTGSKGNCSVFRFGNYIIIIDLGISFLKLNNFLRGNNLTPHMLFITHAHQDHYNEATKRALLKEYPGLQEYKRGKPINKPDNLKLKTFINVHYSHNGEDTKSIGIIFKYDNILHLYATDLGSTTTIPKMAYTFADIEMNYDNETLLENVRAKLRPIKILQRSSTSHLSWEQTTSFLDDVGVTEFSALHMSYENLKRPVIHTKRLTVNSISLNTL